MKEMKKSRSAIFKIMNRRVNTDRIISSFPKPFSFDFTPYKSMDFSEITKKKCLNSETNISELKITKAVILGDVGVGKTSLVNRFCHQVFDANYKSTIGVDFEVEKFEILGVPYNLQIWDTAGQERFKCIAQSYYRSSQIIVLVFNLSKMITLSHVKNWLQEALKVNTGNPHIFLVGTQMDLLSPSAYTNTERHAVKLADDINAEYWAVSAKTGSGVAELFFRMAALAFDDAVFRECERTIATKIHSNLISIKAAKPNKRKDNCSGCALHNN